MRTDAAGRTHTQVVQRPGRLQTHVATDADGKVRTLLYAAPARVTTRVTTDRHGVTRTRVYIATLATPPPAGLKTAVTTERHGKVRTLLLYAQTGTGTGTRRGTGHRATITKHTGYRITGTRYTGRLVTTTDAHGHPLTLRLEGTRTKLPAHLVTVVSTFADGQVKTLLYEARASVAAANGSVAKAPGRLARLQENSRRRVNYRAYYFCGQYLPTVVAVLLALAWRAVDTDIKRLEPFYALSRADGAPGAAVAENLLFVHAWLVPLQAVRRRQWAVCLSAVVHGPLLAATQLLASATVFLDTVTGCDATAPKRTCGSPFLAMNVGFARALQAVLALVAALAVALGVLQCRRRSLLRAEPWSLAGLATLLAGWRAVRPGFGGVAVADSEAAVARRIAARRFRLAHGLLHGQPHLGLEVVHGPYEGSTPAAPSQQNARGHDDQDRDDRDGQDDRDDRDRGRDQDQDDQDDRDDRDRESARDRDSDHHDHSHSLSLAGMRRPIMLSLPAVLVFIAGLLALLVAILVYRFTTNSRLERFLSGQSDAVKALFVLFGVLVRCGWEPIERG